MRNALKPNQWLQNQAMALPDEMEHYARAFVSSNSSGEQPVAPSLHFWTDEELLMHEGEHPILLRFVNAVRVVGMGSALLFMLNRALLTMSGWRDNMPLDTKKQPTIQDQPHSPCADQAGGGGAASEPSGCAAKVVHHHLSLADG